MQRAPLTRDETCAHHPIDVVETVAVDRGWSFERAAQDEINICVKAEYCDYHLAIGWQVGMDSLHAACILDTRVPEARLQDMYELLARINEQLWMGHFDIWSRDRTLLFRNTILVGGAVLSEAQCANFISNAIEMCEQFFPAFQFLIWAGYSPRTAFESSMFETHGEA